MLSWSVVTLNPWAESDRLGSPREENVHDIVGELGWRTARKDQAEASVERGRWLFAENGDVPDPVELEAKRRQVTAFGGEERRLGPSVDTTGELFGSIAGGDAVGGSMAVFFIRGTTIMLRVRHIGEL